MIAHLFYQLENSKRNVLKKVVFISLLIVCIAAIGTYVLAGIHETQLDRDARLSADGEFLQTAQGKLHYRWHLPELFSKNTPIIVMAHGFSTPNFIFEQNAKALSEAGFKVLTFDHFGRGWSDRPSGPYDDIFYEQELLSLLDGLNIKQPVGLVGLSMGGVTTSYFTKQNPKRIKALFLLVPSGFVLANDGSSASGKLLRRPLLGDWFWRVFGREILSGSIIAAEDGPKAANSLQGDPTIQMQYKGYFQALLSSYRNTQMYNRDEPFRELALTGVPTKALFGEQDNTVLISSLDRFKSAMPDAKAEVLDGGHGLNFELYPQVNQQLITYFEQHLKTVDFRSR